MQNFPTPTTVKKLKAFLGLSSYYRRFVKRFSSSDQSKVFIVKNLFLNMFMMFVLNLNMYSDISIL